jgi:hypothetical protein
MLAAPAGEVAARTPFSTVDCEWPLNSRRRTRLTRRATGRSTSIHAVCRSSSGGSARIPPPLSEPCPFRTTLCLECDRGALATEQDNPRVRRFRCLSWARSGKFNMNSSQTPRMPGPDGPMAHGRGTWKRHPAAIFAHPQPDRLGGYFSRGVAGTEQRRPVPQVDACSWGHPDDVAGEDEKNALAWGVRRPSGARREGDRPRRDEAGDQVLGG